MGVLGAALWDFERGDLSEPLIVECDRAPDEEMDRRQFFLPFEAMTRLDQAALFQARGHVLDVGAGAGRHSLALQKRGLTCSALEADELCAELCLHRGVKQVQGSLWQEFEPGPIYDTALALMNGAGLAGTYAGLPRYTDWLASTLAPGGQVLLDTSTVTYLPRPKEPGRRVDEVWFRFRYKEQHTEAFSWLFVDRSDLERHLRRAGLINVRTLFAEPNGRQLVAGEKRK